jgi:sporulation protein YlmC with PRC-barrel domain
MRRKLDPARNVMAPRALTDRSRARLRKFINGRKIMPKRIALLATVAALAVTPALAQQSTTPAPSQPAPQAQPAQTKPDTMKPAESTGMTKSFIDTQTSDQWSASKLIGLKVVGGNNESIGEINDLLVDDGGKVVAAVIGVGGFLGIGEKDVAISFDSVDVMRDADGNEQAKLAMTKEQLQNAPEFKPYEPARSATRTTPTRPAPTTPKN